MAKLSELVECLSDATGVPEKTVRQYARFAREAGLISQGGRGPGGAEMTVVDATNLLLGVMTSAHLNEAARTIQLYRELFLYKPHIRKVPEEGKHPALWDPHPSIPKGFHFLIREEPETRLGEMLQKILWKAATGELQRNLGRFKPAAVLRLEIFRPYPSALIRVDTVERHQERKGLIGAEFAIDYSLLEDDERFEDFDELLRLRWEPDLRTSTAVTQRTIHALGALLAGREGPF